MVQFPQLEESERRKLEEALLRLARPGVHGQLRVEFEMVPVTVHKLRLKIAEKLNERLGFPLSPQARETGNLLFPGDDRGRAASQFLRDFNRKLEDAKLFALVAHIKDGVILETVTERVE
jgi:hypothetical protein